MTAHAALKVPREGGRGIRAISRPKGCEEARCGQSYTAWKETGGRPTWHKILVTQTQHKPLKTAPHCRHIALRGEEQQDEDDTSSISDDRYNDTASRRPSFRYASAASAASTIVQGVHAHACGTSSLICSTIRMATSSQVPTAAATTAPGRTLLTLMHPRTKIGEIDTFPEAFENIVRIVHDVRQWDVGRDEQIKGDFCSSRLSFYTRIGALFRRVVIGAVVGASASNRKPRAPSRRVGVRNDTPDTPGAGRSGSAPQEPALLKVWWEVPRAKARQEKKNEGPYLNLVANQIVLDFDRVRTRKTQVIMFLLNGRESELGLERQRRFDSA
ncbi:hypothetical protein B0H14DRAFT_3717414 [Mycena olivaceomarginata]|nr:hypothetical protein B0H14DRAFT_3717414 [Mycena olivaceomarginata]